jgi:uncharacterized protein YrrD
MTNRIYEAHKKLQVIDIHATDGDIGEVEDFIIDDVSWKIHFLIVETGNWFSGKKVIISHVGLKM